MGWPILIWFCLFQALLLAALLQLVSLAAFSIFSHLLPPSYLVFPRPRAIYLPVQLRYFVLIESHLGVFAQEPPTLLFLFFKCAFLMVFRPLGPFLLMFLLFFGPKLTQDLDDQGPLSQLSAFSPISFLFLGQLQFQFSIFSVQIQLAHFDFQMRFQFFGFSASMLEAGWLPEELIFWFFISCWGFHQVYSPTSYNSNLPLELIIGPALQVSFFISLAFLSH